MNPTEQAIKWIAQYDDQVSQGVKATSANVQRAWDEIAAAFASGGKAFSSVEGIWVEGLDAARISLGHFSSIADASGSDLQKEFTTPLLDLLDVLYENLYLSFLEKSAS